MDNDFYCNQHVSHQRLLLLGAMNFCMCIINLKPYKKIASHSPELNLIYRKRVPDDSAGDSEISGAITVCVCRTTSFRMSVDVKCRLLAT